MRLRNYDASATNYRSNGIAPRLHLTNSHSLLPRSHASHMSQSPPVYEYLPDTGKPGFARMDRVLPLDKSSVINVFCLTWHV